jgi:hypothetical protein
VNTAYRCALVLRDLVAPHLLRRRKVDVKAQLPRKTEQVGGCWVERSGRGKESKLEVLFLECEPLLTVC